jgi:hypothetical protein
MGDTYNIYCDESCHLRNDGQKAMVLGALWCPASEVRSCNEQIRAIKSRHNVNRKFEVKWTKVSPGKVALYRDLVDFFFDADALHFRALIVPDKSKLTHEAFDQTHDDWYFKMYFDLLKVILERKSSYRIFLDIKDTRSSRKVAKLHEVLTNNMYDFDRNIVRTVQTVHSHEIELLQLCDLMIGAVSYANRGLATSAAKRDLIEQIRRRSGLKLTLTTLLREQKVNLFRWKAGEAGA